MKNNKILQMFLIFVPVALLVAFLIAKFSLLGFAGSIGVILLIIILVILFKLIIKNPLLGVLLVAFTLPFERIPTYSLGGMTLKIDQLFAGITIIVLLLKILFERKKIQPYPIGWSIAAFLLVCFASVLNAVDKTRALSVFIFTIFMVGVSYLVVNIVDSKEKLISVIKTLFLSAFIVCIFGLYQFLGDVAGLPITLTGLKDIYTKAIMGFPRIQAFSMEPLYLANFLFISLGLALGLFIFKNNKVIKNSWLISLIVLILVIIVLGISRGAYVALAAMILFFILFFAKRFLTVRNIIIFVASIIIIGGAAYGFLKISNPDALDSFISHAKVEDTGGESVQKRLTDYEKAINYWQESPVIGIGPGNFGPRDQDYPGVSQTGGWDIVNNEYLEILCETGILGSIFFVIVLLILLIRSIIAYKKCQDPTLKAVLIGLFGTYIAVLVQYNFFSTLYIMHIWFLIGLMIVVQNLCLNKQYIEVKR